jgi:hypothetical protein
LAKFSLIIGSILILFFLNVANAEDEYSTYRFDCKARFITDTSIILSLELPDQVNEDGPTEVEIALDGELMDAYYARDEFRHIWYLVSDTDLQIIMDAELHADYFDFRNKDSALPETQFECQKVKNRK